MPLVGATDYRTRLCTRQYLMLTWRDKGTYVGYFSICSGESRGISTSLDAGRAQSNVATYGNLRHFPSAKRRVLSGDSK